MAIIDAGVEHITLFDSKNRRRVNTDVGSFDRADCAEVHDGTPFYITGELSSHVKATVGSGIEISTEAALWQSARDLIKNPENEGSNSLGIIELSASGYIVLAVNKDGGLKDGLLLTNPHCGAGSGLNLTRILEKTNIPHEKVDEVLQTYVGVENREKRAGIPIRADRCGVFSSSATVSDRNQGVPLDYALAVTLKSEVLKACKKMTRNTEKVYLTGGVFRWQFARDCAEDYLISIGVKEVAHDSDHSLVFDGVRSLSEEVGHGNFSQSDSHLSREKELSSYPSFGILLDSYRQSDTYLRSQKRKSPEISSEMGGNPIRIALDVGSTMAKIAISDATTGEILFLESYDNNGDTIQIIQHIFQEIGTHEIENLNIQHIGITGSGRYQVQKVLGEIWPHLSQQGRIGTLVENYAHAHGSIEEARERIAELKAKGHEVNEDDFVVVDVGGEDTKITVVSLKEGELAENAMNLKCSAGTGSLMDTLKSLFDIQNIEEACSSAMKALQGYSINATCAVLLMENAQKMRAAGYPNEEILASCYWAIVENMARTLWSQIKIPKNSLVLMHGQTMLSDPLPLAIMHRIQKHTGSHMYGLVPENPGHRACLGLLRNTFERVPLTDEVCNIEALTSKRFDKKLITCHGAACGNGEAGCTRTVLRFEGADHESCTATLGGCSSVNETRTKAAMVDPPKGYKTLRRKYGENLPKSDDPKRVVIPRSFAVSEEAYFLSQIFEGLDIPVHVDDVTTDDVFRAQPYFNVDTCAPNIGATGQLMRLASEPHGAILAPQIDFLPTEGKSTGRTCINEQAGTVIATHFAKAENPNAKIHCFDLSLQRLDPVQIAAQLYGPLTKVFAELGRTISREDFLDAIKTALERRQNVNTEIADEAAGYIEEANEKGQRVVIVCGREYVLHPGVYDNHAARLFRDKGVVTIPSDVLEVELADEFKDVYWKNQHQVLTIVQAIRDKKLHTILKNKRLAAAIEKAQISISFVSAFLCGPDSVTMPLIQELMKNDHTLVLQSDAAIGQLAHLESRVDTYLRRLQSHVEEFKKEEPDFEMASLDDLDSSDLNPETDVVYINTIGDNRLFTALMRSAGFTTVENYSDEDPKLGEKIDLGRQQLGDNTCAPMVAMYADAVLALQDFAKKKRENHPSVAGKHRIVYYYGKFNNPCRQGRYHDLYKLDISKKIAAEREQDQDRQAIDFNFLVGQGKTSFEVPLPPWVNFQTFHSIVVKDVLENMYLKGGSMCRDKEEYDRFYQEFQALKAEIVQVFENIQPSKLSQKLDELTDEVKPLQMMIRYFTFGIYNNNGLRKKLSRFAKKWIQRKDRTERKRLNVHIDGELYMRIAQSADIFKAMVDAIGFDSFDVTNTPLFGLYEYIILEQKMIAEDRIKQAEESAKFVEPQERGRYEKTVERNKKVVKSCATVIAMIRKMLAEPLYKAAGLEAPHSLAETLEVAKEILPNRKPEEKCLTL